MVAPSIELAVRRLAAVLDGGTPKARALTVPAPPGASVVEFTWHGNQATALVDGERAWIGRDGAERALSQWVARGEVPEPTRLARTVGALVYPGCAVLRGGERAGDGGEYGPPPALTAHPGGGRVLTFSFVIPEGRSGAGLHVARWRWTDSGLLIEASPHPERR